MRRYLYLLSPVLSLLSVSYAIAQTITADNPPPPAEAAWEIMVKGAFALAMSAFGPFITGYVKNWPPLAKYVVASLAGMLAGAVAGQVPGFPLTSESAANMGMVSGATGQAMVNGWLRREPEPAKTGG